MKIEIGRKVVVRFEHDDVFEFQNGALQLECILLNMPRGEGDHFRFDYNGIEFTVNPLASGFVGVIAGAAEG